MALLSLKPPTFISANLFTTNNPKTSTFKCNFSLATIKCVKFVASTAVTNLEVGRSARNGPYLYFPLDCAVVDSLREDADADGLRYLDDLCSNPSDSGEVSSSTGKLTVEGLVLALATDTVAALGPCFEFMGAAGNGLGLDPGYSAVAVKDLFLEGLESEAKVSGYHAHNSAPSIMGGFVLNTGFDPLELKRFLFPENTGGVVYMNGNKFPPMVSSFYYGLQGNVLVIEQKRGSSRGLFPMPSSPLLWGNLRAIKPNRSSSLAKHFVVHSSSGGSGSGGSGSGGSGSGGFGKSSEDSSKGPPHWLKFVPGLFLCLVAIGLAILSYKGVLNKELLGQIKYALEVVAALLATINAGSMFIKNNS